MGQNSLNKVGRTRLMNLEFTNPYGFEAAFIHGP
jgi:hypothetical protein